MTENLKKKNNMQCVDGNKFACNLKEGIDSMNKYR